MYIGEMPNKIMPDQIAEFVSGIAKENEEFFYISKYTYLKTFIVLVSNQRILTCEKDLGSIKQEIPNEQITDISKDIGKVVKIDLANKKSLVLGLEKSDLQASLEALSLLKPGSNFGSSLSKDIEQIGSDWQETKREIGSDWQEAKKELGESKKEIQKAFEQIGSDWQETKREIGSDWQEAKKELGESKKEIQKAFEQLRESFGVSKDYIEKFGRCIESGSVGMKSVDVFETGFVSVSRGEPEKLLAIQSSINVSKKTGLGRTIGQTAALFSPGMLAAGATSNRRGDVYLMIVTDKNTYSLKEDLSSLSATLKNFESEQEVLKLEAAGQAVIEMNRTGGSSKNETMGLGIAEEIGKLKNLLELGAISEEEFQNAKNKLLG